MSDVLGLILTFCCCALIVWAVLDSRRRRRMVKAEVDAVINAFRALPSEEQRAWVHPGSPKKPSGWTVEEYQKARDRAVH